MKPLLVLLALLGPLALRADDLRPDSSGVPILQVFPLVRTASEQVAIDRDHPLLSIETVSDFFLKADRRRVRLVLTPDDAKAFASILQDHEAVAVAAGQTTALIKSGRGFNGSLTFDNPVAAYLRQRFHVKPDSNEVDPPPLSPFAAPTE
jgi:hypothetical protein